jgi:hypothetical protein
MVSSTLSIDNAFNKHLENLNLEYNHYVSEEKFISEFE